MSHKKTKNLTLAIHIDSAEVHLAAGYVEKGIGKVNIIALNKTHIRGISKGNITNKDTFTSSFSQAIRNFLLQDLTVSNPELAKQQGLAIDDNGKYVIERLAFNSLISERNSVSGSYLQSTIVKDILIKEFFPENVEVIQNENLFSCTADVATTNLLAATDLAITEKEYTININFGRYSTGINFVANTQANQIYSKSIELGFQDLVNTLNNHINFNPPAELDEVYLYLKSYQFDIVRTRTDRSIRVNFIRGKLGDKNKLNEIFVSQLQYIFHQCYSKFKELDSQELRLSENFIKKVNINLMGYGADFETAYKCLALIFTERLKDELEIRKREIELQKSKAKRLTKVSTEDSNVVFNLATGEAYTNLPSINAKYKQIIYNDLADPANTFQTQACRLTPIIYEDQTYLGGMTRFSKIGYSIDQYATALGLIYNFYLAQPNHANKKSFLKKLYSVFRL